MATEGELIPAGETPANVPIIYTDLMQRAQARELIEAGKVLLEKSSKYTVTIASPADAEKVSEFRARLAKTISALDEERLAATEQARKVVADINKQALTEVTPLKEALEKVDRALKDHRAEQERQRLAAIEANAKAVAAAPADKPLPVEVLPPEPPKSIRGTHGSTTSFVDNWKWRIIDTKEQPAAESVKLIPEMWLLPPEERIDRKALNGFVKSKKDKTNVPGIEVYNDPDPRSRTAR